MWNGEWPVSTKQLLDAISWQKTLIEGQLEPVLTKLIDDQIAPMKNQN